MSKQKRLETRYAWIEASLRYAGGFDKKSYGRHFAINAPQISADQSGFVTLMNDRLSRREPGILADDGAWLEIRKGKIHILRGLPRRPVFDIPSLREWLAASSTIPYVRLHDFNQVDPDPEILRRICHAILRKHALQIRLSGPDDGEWRTVSPHAIIDIDGCLHVRACNHQGGAFEEFPISAIREASPCGRSVAYVNRETDQDWIQKDRLIIEADPNGDPSGIAHAVSDFGLDPDRLARRIEAPRALRPHLETRLRCRIEQVADHASCVRVRAETA